MAMRARRTKKMNPASRRLRQVQIREYGMNHPGAQAGLGGNVAAQKAARTAAAQVPDNNPSQSAAAIAAVKRNQTDQAQDQEIKKITDQLEAGDVVDVGGEQVEVVSPAEDATRSPGKIILKRNDGSEIEVDPASINEDNARLLLKLARAGLDASEQQGRKIQQMMEALLPRTTWDRFLEKPLIDQLAILEHVDVPRVKVKINEGAVPDNSSVTSLNRLLSAHFPVGDRRKQMEAYLALPVPSMLRDFWALHANEGPDACARDMLKKYMEKFLPDAVKGQMVVPLKESEVIEEGPNDPGIFRAVFTAGGPGSGKTTVARRLGLLSAGLKSVTCDDALEMIMLKRGLNFQMPPEEDLEREEARTRAKELKRARRSHYTDQRLGMLLDSTGVSPDKILRLKTKLEEIGYHTAMVFVDTPVETALANNRSRGSKPDPATGRPGRQVPSEAVVSMNARARESAKVLGQEFEPWFMVVENDMSPLHFNPTFRAAEKRIGQFLSQDHTATADDWLANARKRVTESPRMVSSPNEGDPLSKVQIDGLERYADRLFSKLDIDVTFTAHFRERLNDARNGKQITFKEVVSMFDRAFQQQGQRIGSLDPVTQAVLKDMESDINMPFVFKWDSGGDRQFELVAKTVMRKPDFHSPNDVIAINEAVARHGVTGETFAEFVRHAMESLELEKLPEIRLVPKLKNTGSFAVFSYSDPERPSIEVATESRHPADVMRSLAHELVHYSQFVRGDHLDGETGSECENEANATAGVIMREFAQHLFEMSAGGVAGVAMPLGGTQRRSGKKKKKKKTAEGSQNKATGEQSK
jgi:preprotein translocase subunit YajC